MYENICVLLVEGILSSEVSPNSYKCGDDLDADILQGVKACGTPIVIEPMLRFASPGPQMSEPINCHCLNQLAGFGVRIRDVG
jgi:hypothetical protein